ncbi:MAG: insulinase family protein [Clostridiales bacterium]|jgi:predicted Zn-dependent peptidase|nr:insulinase family protein [Clostridiales bacterium]
MRNIVTNEKLAESYTYIKHPSGLSIYIYPKEGYKTSYAVFGTKYGSIDTCFKRSDKDEYNKIPEGTAHFLEHKLFESEDLDAFDLFAKTGAQANAYTTFDRTCYLFSCSGNFNENLDILLNFVLSPYFTAETVQKEQGIIGQEINMCKDMPGRQSFFNFLRAMYKNHPVNIDIAGTVNSIAKITADTLFTCYDTFYNLNNMALAVAGNVDEKTVIEIADKALKTAQDITIDRVFDDEPETVVSQYIEEKMSVSIPLFDFGFKEIMETPERSLKEVIVKRIILEVLASKTSPLYKELLEEGLINDEFEAEYFTGTGYGMTIFSGESNEPKKVTEKIKEAIKKLKESKITEEDFERARKRLYGEAVMSFNNISGIANGLLVSHFKGDDLFSEFNILAGLMLEDINNALKDTFNENAQCLSVVIPK